MRTRKLVLLLIAIFVLAAEKINAQNIYTRAWGGYSIKSNSSSLPGYLQADIYEFATNILPSPERPAHNLRESGSREYIHDSYGKGGNIGLAAGNMFSKHFGAELGISYLLGGKINYRSDFDKNGEKLRGEFASKINMLQITPSIVFDAGFDKISPYARVGILIGAFHRVNTSFVLVEPGNYETQDQLRGNASVGAVASVGVTYTLSDKMAIFLETEFKSLSYKPDTREVVSIIQDGDIENVEDKYSFPKQSLVPELNEGLPNQFAGSRPEMAFSVSSIGINVGVKFAFGSLGSGPRSR